MLLSKGEIVFVVTRRFFEKDLRRSFVGKIQEVSEVAIRVKGYPFTYTETTNEFVRTDHQRIQIFSLVDAGVVIRILDEDVDYKNIHYGWKDNQRIITDGKSFIMDISSFGLNR
jgi:hypothetical protein